MTVLPSRPRPLTPSERVYLRDAAKGLTAQQSADRRGVTVNTVLSMLKRAKAALGATNITHAVALAVTTGEIAITSPRGKR